MALIWYTPTNCADINDAMVEGFKANGDAIGSAGTFDVACFWSMHKKHHIERCRRSNKPFLLMERAYLGDRFTWVSLGFNGLNGNADFCNENAPSDRWERYWKGSVKPWKNDGLYALVIGQVPGDASLEGKSIHEWAGKACREAKEVYGEVVYRPHPSEKQKRMVRGAGYHTGSLQDALKDAAVCITYCSNTAVEAVMAGVPAVSYSKTSMAWGVTSHSISDPLYRGDRDDWGRRIAYSQWLPEEIKSGEAWAHLRGFINE